MHNQLEGNLWGISLKHGFSSPLYIKPFQYIHCQKGVLMENLSSITKVNVRTCEGNIGLPIFSNFCTVQILYPFLNDFSVEN